MFKFQIKEVYGVPGLFYISLFSLEIPYICINHVKEFCFFVTGHFLNYHQSLPYLLPLKTSKIPQKVKQRFYSLIKHGFLKIR